MKSTATSEAGPKESLLPIKPKLVIFHGYGASGVIFYKIIQPLVEAGMHVILVDIIGMGSSSRPDFD